MIKKVEEKFILEQKDIGTIVNCLNYAWHRLKKHQVCGISGVVKIEEVERLRKEFGVEVKQGAFSLIKLDRALDKILGTSL